MSMIKITKENLPSVCGRLRKFFYNKNETGFEMWHNFNCGKRKITSFVRMNDGDVVNVKHEQPAPQSVELEKTYIRITYYKGVEGEVLNIGDEIQFLGSRIVTKKKWFFDKKYIYSVIQAKNISETSANSYNSRMEFDLMWQSDYDDLEFA